MEISILCKVVDNFGDIGFAWRMARRFKELNSRVKINLIVDGLSAFFKIENSVNPEKKFQIIKKIRVFDWNARDFCYDYFFKNGGKKLSLAPRARASHPRIANVIECFQCGRPEWLEKILFKDKPDEVFHILMVDYLTAEKYAEDFHKLPSLTRREKVRKINFMPGFTKKTGGLIIENEWKNPPKRNKNGPVLFFVYEKNWDGIAKSVAESSPCKIIAAAGAGFNSVKKSFKNMLSDEDFASRFKGAPFCNQKKWDFMLKSCSFLFIRGEESLSRACLSGVPFVWHAYPQSDDYQLVKVNALLKIMEKYFSANNFKIVKELWILVNSPQRPDFKTNFTPDFNADFDFKAVAKTQADADAKSDFDLKPAKEAQTVAENNLMADFQRNFGVIADTETNLTTDFKAAEETNFQNDFCAKTDIEANLKSDFEMTAESDFSADFQSGAENDFKKVKTACDNFLKNGDELSKSFANFAQDLRKNGDLCANIMTFVKKKYIISKS